MIAFIDWLERQTHTTILALTMILIGFISCVDYGTGINYSVVILYPLPIMMIAWRYGVHAGTSLAAICALIWVSIDLMLGKKFAHISVPIWNTTVQFIFFILFSIFIDSIRSLLSRERHLARHDPLTGAINMRFFRDMLQKKIIVNTDQPFALAYIDVDNFKKINDTFGHDKGDEVLLSLVSLIRKHIRADDCIARLGGDEFALLLPNTSEKDAHTVLSRVQDQFHQTAMRNNWPISLSIGATVVSTSKLPINALIRHADSLMYAIKREGKNGIAIQSI